MPASRPSGPRPAVGPRRCRGGQPVGRLGLSAVLLLAFSNFSVSLRPALAVPPTPLNEEIGPGAATFVRLEHPDGPSHNSIFAITQDHQGFLWIGTQDGLNRFDGYDFEVHRHDPRRVHSLSANRVNAILEDSRRRLWIGTSQGIDHFDRATRRFDRFPLPPDAAGPIHDLVEGSDGTLWAASSTGVLRLAPNENHWKGVSTEAVDGQVRRVRPAEDGVLWYLVDSPGFEPNRLCRQDQTSSRCHAIGTALAFDLDLEGNPWFGVLPGEQLHGATFPQDGFDAASERLILDVLFEPDGRIWAASDRGLETSTPGAADGRTVEHPFGERSDMLSGYVSRVFRDRSRTLWLGTEHGLYRHDPFAKPIRHHGLHEIPANQGQLLRRGPAVSALAEGPEGTVWVGSFEPGGLYRLDTASGRWDRSPLGDSVPNQHIWALLAEEQTLWIGLSSSLCRAEWPSDQLRCEDLAATSQAIVRDDQDRLWRSGHGALLRLESSQEWTRYSYEAPDLAPEAAEILHLLADEGGIWIGAWGGPLRRLDLAKGSFETWRRVDPSGWEQVSPIFDLHRTGDGLLWLATGDGLSRFDPATEEFLHYTHADGLPGTNVFSLLPESDQVLWLGTNRGLARVQIEAGAVHAVRSFGVSDGVVNVEFNRNARLRTEEGRFLFGGLDGVTEFLPWGIRPNPVPPPIALTGIEVLGDEGSRAVEPYGLERLILQPDDRTLAIDYVALGLTNPERNAYSFRLHGFEPEWVDAGNQRRARYANLPPGDYLFQLRAANSDGLWSPHTLELGIEVRPAVWETWWFRAAMVFALAVLLGMAHRLQVRRKIEVERLRLRIAGDLHDELGSDLSGIALAANRVGDREYLQARDRRQLRDIASTSHQVMESLRDIVWYINPEHDTLVSLTDRMRSVAARLLADLDVRFEASVGAPTGGRLLPMKLRRDLFLSYKELLHNVQRHSQASRVTICLTVDADWIRLTVADDGIGFDPEASGDGTGLASLRRRAQRLGAVLDITSEPGATGIRLEVPWSG